MSRVLVNRRTVLGAVAGVVATPAYANLPQRAVDVAIVGGGSAGISAARSLVRAGLSTMVVEATSRIGGRCFSDRVTFDVPVDVGAHWIHGAEQNPLAKLGRDLGFDVYEEDEEDVLFIGDRRASDEEWGAYDRSVDEAEQALVRYGWRPEDGSTLAGLPRDLGDWRSSVMFRLGSYEFGKSLADISSWDFARAQHSGDMLCRQGFGSLLRATARGLPIAFNAPVDSVTVSNDEVRLGTSQGTLRARAAIITVPIGVLASGRIRFSPGLPDVYTSAVDALAMGSNLRVLLEIRGELSEIGTDNAIYAKSDNDRTFGAIARVSGTNVWFLDTGGAYARELEAAGDQAAVEAAVDWLAACFGNDIRRIVARTLVSRWGRSEFCRGGFSVAAPGRSSQRAAFRLPHADRVFFAGEHRHDTAWGTVGGAWETGELAAQQAIELLRR
jgi:monoamine oxidase